MALPEEERARAVGKLLVHVRARIEQRGQTPDTILVLTFSRKAAEQLRDRVSARLGRTTASQLSSTFHSFAYALVRRYAPAELYDAPLRLLSAPEQDVILRELLVDNPESVQWPDRFRQAMSTRGFAREVQAVLARAQGVGSVRLVQSAFNTLEEAMWKRVIAVVPPRMGTATMRQIAVNAVKEPPGELT